MTAAARSRSGLALQKTEAGEGAPNEQEIWAVPTVTHLFYSVFNLSSVNGRCQSEEVYRSVASLAEGFWDSPASDAQLHGGSPG